MEMQMQAKDHDQDHQDQDQDQEDKKYNSEEEHDELDQYVEEEKRNIALDEHTEEEKDTDDHEHNHHYFDDDEDYQSSEFNMFSAFQNPGKDFSLFAPVQDSTFGANDQMSFNLLHDPNQHSEDEDEVLNQFGNLQELRNMSENYNYDIANKDISTKFPK
jgi:hypothetical protein